MAQLQKVDSNITGLRYAWESSFGVLPTSPAPTWYPLEPNSYDDFGGELTLLARNPINPSRQRKKGVITDLDSSGGFNMDLTQENFQDIGQAFFFANMRRKSEKNVTTISGSPLSYQVTGAGDYEAGDLIFAKYFDDAANNGLKQVSSITGSPASGVAVSGGGLAAASTQTGVISRVGYQFTTGDAELDASGTLPALITTTKDLTDFGLIPGEWIYIGGDTTATRFTGATDNYGWARVRSIAANEITFDKTERDFTTDAGTGKTVRIFFGRVLKNEVGNLIVRKPVQLERELGYPDDSDTSAVQAEYLEGGIANEATFNVGTADKISVDMSFIGKDFVQRTATQGRKTGSRPSVREADAFNTSSDVKRIALSRVVTGEPNPDRLFAFVTDLSLSINNNVSPNKAVSVLGAFEVTAGTFEVSISATAYFSNVEAVQAVRDNDDVSLDMMVVKNNAGIVWDFPLLSLGDGRPNVEQDEPITLPLTGAAATGAKIDPDLDHTLLMGFFDYLPSLAEG